MLAEMNAPEAVPETAPGIINPPEVVEKLCQENVGLVHWWVRRLTAKNPPTPDDYDDLVAAGMSGLLRSARSFDERRKVEISTYASFMIRCEVLRELNRQKSHGFSGTRGGPKRMLGPVPKIGLIPDGYDLPAEPTQTADSQLKTRLVAQLVENLSPRDARVCYLKWVRRLTLREISEQEGVCREAIRQRITRARAILMKSEQWQKFLEDLAS